MATYTTNLNLKKPATSDKIRIADFNNNADLIDAGYATQDTSLGKLGGGMAIIATGNVHAAISAGQFVYVRKHETLAEGLYTADSNISANATLSASNLTAVSGGGLNKIAGNLSATNLGSFDNMDSLKAAIISMVSSGLILGDIRYFRFNPQFTDTDAGFSNSAYGERIGQMFFRDASHFTCIITFNSGTVTIMALRDTTWTVYKINN